MKKTICLLAVLLFTGFIFTVQADNFSPDDPDYDSSYDSGDVSSQVIEPSDQQTPPGAIIPPLRIRFTGHYTIRY